MRTFKDADGNEWTLAFTINSAKQLRDRSIDLFDADVRASLLGDPPLVQRVAWELVKDQAEKRNITFEKFDQIITRSFVVFTETFATEFAFFCRCLGKEAEARIIEAVLAAEKQGEMIANRKLSEININELIDTELGKAEQVIDQHLAQLKSGETSMKSPASSVSNPAR